MAMAGKKSTVLVVVDSNRGCSDAAFENAVRQHLTLSEPKAYRLVAVFVRPKKEAETVVLSTPSQVQHYYYYTLPMEKFWAEKYLEIRSRYAQMAADMLPTGLEFQMLEVQGEPGRSIVAACRDMNADLLVMGSTRSSQSMGFGWLFGGLITYVMGKAPCPVVVVQGPKSSMKSKSRVAATSGGYHSLEAGPKEPLLPATQTEVLSN